MIARRNLLLLASIVASLAFYVLRDADIPFAALVSLKGLPVALLAIHALTSGVGKESRHLAAIMALGSLGDMLIEWRLEAGALAFFAGHLAAMALFMGHRREKLTPSQKGATVALLLLTPLAALQLANAQAALYALALGGMAASAWASSFPRYRVGIGAVLFVASDLLIFARLGPQSASALPGILIWPLYYAGQLLICTGVIRHLASTAHDQHPNR
jgi:YhhN family